MSICQYELHAEGHRHQRPDNRSMPHNRYGLPTLGDESEALLQWGFDQHLPPSLIRTFTARRDQVNTISATESTEFVA